MIAFLCYTTVVMFAPPLVASLVAYYSHEDF